MTSKVINISIPTDLLRQIDEAACAESRTRSELLREAARRYIAARQWQAIQTVVAARAREAGLRTEDDIEELIDATEAASVSQET
jgi:CopG family transcriptional regulator/antitoxin EndoAI